MSEQHRAGRVMAHMQKIYVQSSIQGWTPDLSLKAPPEQWECGRASQQATYLQQSANTEPLKGWYLSSPAQLSGDYCVCGR